MEFKAYLNQKYQGYDSFIENIIYPIFGEDRYETAYNIEMLEQNPELVGLAERTGISSVIYCGIIELEDNPVYLFDITVKDKVMMERNRVAVQTLVKRVMDTYSGAFMLIHYEQSDKWDWRFTFCQLKDKGEYTDSKRYTFLLGPNQACTTAAQNFIKLAAKGGDIEIGDIVKAFDVEALSDEFFGKYKAHYEAFVEYITGKRYEGKDEKVIHDPHPFFTSLFGGDDKAVRDYVKLLLGRITFLHFLQKKGWLGVPENGEWGSGDEQFMLNQFETASPELKDDFVVSVLNPLFFDALDCDRTGKKDVFDSKVFGRIRVPYLNGGMFEKADKDAVAVKWPAEYFGKLFRFFSEYNFTIDENDPNEAQVGVDPEMLGKIFENLLEDNKDKGAFYTPKEIVKYMCQESLIAYLKTKTGFEEKMLRDFVHSPEEGKAAFSEDQQYAILDAILNVKICDPAIGSGAFPIGLLNELVWCKEAIYGDKKGRAEIKREIIRDNIYGIDIEKGAVEIARLRFWLSLVVDEEQPEPLPNLDFKIMQGNSLLEKYHNFNLVELMQPEQGTLVFSDEAALRDKLKSLMKRYFDCNSHQEKKRLKAEISDTIKKQIKQRFPGLDMPDMDMSENDKFFLCHTWFGDVFGTGGFDIVIGNPPYIQLQINGGELAGLYDGCSYSTFARTGDIYCLFYERGWQLLKKDGHLCFITSNKWMRAGYGEKTREFFANKTNPMLLIDFAGVKIFENATVDTNILLFSKSDNQHETVCAVTNKQDKESIKNLSVFVQQQNSICDFGTSESWVVLSPIEQSIKRKIEAVGTPLKDWDIQINYGIKTGFNDAFIISTEKRNEILQNCKDADERKRTEELIRPILRGRDIKRYEYDWANLYLIATFPSKHYDINNYQAVKQYLLSFGIERLEQTGKTYFINGEKVKARKQTSNKWYETQDSISYWEDFLKPKIIYPNMTKYLPFVYDNKKYATNQKCFIITGKNVAYLTAFFNSSLFKYCFRDSFPELQGGTRELSKIFFDKIPVCEISDSQSLLFQNIVEDIQKEYTKQKALRIDSMLFDLYDLTPEEREAIGFVEIV